MGTPSWKRTVPSGERWRASIRRVTFPLCVPGAAKARGRRGISTKDICGMARSAGWKHYGTRRLAAWEYERPPLDTTARGALRPDRSG